MITPEQMDRLAAEAVERFPIPRNDLAWAGLTGDRSVVEGPVRERVLWMLNEVAAAVLIKEPLLDGLPKWWTGA